MPKLSLDYIKDLCELANYRNSLPEAWKPYFDYWSEEVAAGRITVDKRPVNGAVEETWIPPEVIHPNAIQLALRAMYNEGLVIKASIMIDETEVTPDAEEATEGVEVAVPAEDTEETFPAETEEAPVEEEAA